MYFYLFAILFLYIIWKLKDYICYKELKNFSKTSTPIIKTSFNIAYQSQGLSIIKVRYRESAHTPEIFLISADEIFNFLRKHANHFQASYVHFFFGLWSFEVCRAKDAERILGSAKHIDKGEIYNFLHPFLKTGLLTANGEKWHTRRRFVYFYII